MGKRVTVLITGVGGRSVGCQILEALLPLEADYRLVVTDAARFSYGLYRADSRYLVPPAASPDYLPALQRVIEREEVEVVLPGTQPEMGAVAANPDALLPHCTFVVNPAPVIDLCANKQRLYAWLAANGVDVPRTVGGAQWEALARELGFPLIAKPTEDTGGSRGVAILANAAEVCAYLNNVNPAGIVFQEYVGAPEEEYTVGVMVSREGAVIDSIVMRRNLVGLTLGTQRRIEGRTVALSSGYSQGYIVAHPVIQAACEQLALQIGIRGPANFQLRMDGERVVIFEVHPRFSGTTSIRAAVGFNEPDVLIRNFRFGERFGRLGYRTDVAAIRAFRHVIVPMSVMDAVPEAGQT